MNKITDRSDFTVPLLFLLKGKFLGILLAVLQAGLLFDQIACIFLTLS